MPQNENATQPLEVSSRKVTVFAGAYRDSGFGTYMDCPFHLHSHRAEVRRRERSVLIIPGAGFADFFWLATPDGRPGWADLLLRAGFDVHILTQPLVCASGDVLQGGPGLTTLSAEVYERLFTAPHVGRTEWLGAERHNQWPGTGRRGDPIFDRLYAAQVPFVEDTAVAERGIAAAAAAVLTQTGPVTLLSHSRGACLGWVLADRCPNKVESIVAVEPQGPPAADFFHGLGHLEFGLTNTPLQFDPLVDGEGLAWRRKADGSGWVYDGPNRRLPALAGKPVVVVTGEASYHVAFDHLTVDFLRRMGVTTEHCLLEETGVTGNGHLMMLEKNNADIAALIANWIAVATKGQSERQKRG